MTDTQIERGTAPAWAEQVAPGVLGLRIALANVFLVGPAGAPEGPRHAMRWFDGLALLVIAVLAAYLAVQPPLRALEGAAYDVLLRARHELYGNSLSRRELRAQPSPVVVVALDQDTALRPPFDRLGPLSRRTSAFSLRTFQSSSTSASAPSAMYASRIAVVR